MREENSFLYTYRFLEELLQPPKQLQSKANKISSILHGYITSQRQLHINLLIAPTSSIYKLRAQDSETISKTIQQSAIKANLQPTKKINQTSEVYKKMKLIYYSIAVTLFCMGSFAAPTGRVRRQADNMCTCTRNLTYESELKTGLRILKAITVIILYFLSFKQCLLKLILIQHPTRGRATKTIPVVAALCKVRIASRDVDNQYLSEEQKEMINNKTCNMVSTL